MDKIRLTDGIAGSVEHTAFSFDAVILPALMRNHSGELAWVLVSSSTAFDWSKVTTTSVSSGSCSKSSNDLSRCSGLKRSQRGGGNPFASELGT